MPQDRTIIPIISCSSHIPLRLLLDSSPFPASPAHLLLCADNAYSLHKIPLALLFCAIITLFLHKLHFVSKFCAVIHQFLHKLCNPSGFCHAQNTDIRHPLPPGRVPCGAGDAKKSPCAKHKGLQMSVGKQTSTQVCRLNQAR